MADIITLGIDVGSTTSKCIVLKNGSEIIGQSIISAGTGTTGPARAMAAALESASISRENITCLAATGYGRNSFDGADFVVSELTAHAIGAHATFPEARTVIDIGGQDAKVLRIGTNGKLDNFVMNDKCAAGTGRFLDMMARVLELDISEMEKYDEKATSPTRISSTCTVFAESEVISQLSNNVAIPDLVAGIHMSVAVRTASLARRLGVTEPVVMTGGVAKNGGIIRALERELKTTIAVSPLSQLNGAYGAAIYAYEKHNA